MRRRDRFAGVFVMNTAVSVISSRLARRVPYGAGNCAASRNQWITRDKLKIIGTQ